MNSVRLILASRSPRRADLLREAGLDVTCVTPGYDDPDQPDSASTSSRVSGPVDPSRAAAELAERKARSAPLSQVDKDDPCVLVVGADTIVVDDAGRLMGKPTDRESARQMIRTLTDAWHDVVTGVALWAPATDACETFADTAHVHVGQVSDASLEAYLDSDQWRGKAGGYNLFERQDHWPIRVEGDPTTVVGLPMRILVDRLTSIRVES